MFKILLIIFTLTHDSLSITHYQPHGIVVKSENGSRIFLEFFIPCVCYHKNWAPRNHKFHLNSPPQDLLSKVMMHTTKHHIPHPTHETYPLLLVLHTVTPPLLGTPHLISTLVSNGWDRLSKKRERKKMKRTKKKKKSKNSVLIPSLTDLFFSQYYSVSENK